MILRLPYPPTANLYWRVFRGRPVKSAKARSYQQAVGLLARAEGCRPVAGPVRVDVSVFRPRRLGDLDNTLKVLLDALRGIAYVDDSQVIELSARRYDDARNPRALVTIDELSP